MGKPRDHTDAAKDIARDLAEIASHIGQLKGDARAYLSDPNYDTLKHRLESALCGGGHCCRGQAEDAAERGAARVRFLYKEGEKLCAGSRGVLPFPSC
jgi:hypothetical protein